MGVKYVMDRDGKIYHTGGPGSKDIMRGWGAGAGLSNENTVGMEIIAKDDKDVTRAQVLSAQAFARKHNTPVFGRGEVNPGHKQATEGWTVTHAIREERRGLDAATRKGGDTTVKHEGHAKVSVDFRNMPKGVKTARSAQGVFKEVKLNRRGGGTYHDSDIG